MPDVYIQFQQCYTSKPHVSYLPNDTHLVTFSDEWEDAEGKHYLRTRWLVNDTFWPLMSTMTDDIGRSLWALATKGNRWIGDSRHRAVPLRSIRHVQRAGVIWRSFSLMTTWVMRSEAAAYPGANGSCISSTGPGRWHCQPGISLQSVQAAGKTWSVHTPTAGTPALKVTDATDEDFPGLWIDLMTRDLDWLFENYFSKPGVTVSGVYRRGGVSLVRSLLRSVVMRIGLATWRYGKSIATHDYRQPSARPERGGSLFPKDYLISWVSSEQAVRHGAHTDLCNLLLIAIIFQSILYEYVHTFVPVVNPVIARSVSIENSDRGIVVDLVWRKRLGDLSRNIWRARLRTITPTSGTYTVMPDVYESTYTAWHNGVKFQSGIRNVFDSATGQLRKQMIRPDMTWQTVEIYYPNGTWEWVGPSQLVEYYLTTIESYFSIFGKPWSSDEEYMLLHAAAVIGGPDVQGMPGRRVIPTVDHAAQYVLVLGEVGKQIWFGDPAWSGLTGPVSWREHGQQGEFTPFNYNYAQTDNEKLVALKNLRAPKNFASGFRMPRAQYTTSMSDVYRYDETDATRISRSYTPAISRNVSRIDVGGGFEPIDDPDPRGNYYNTNERKYEPGYTPAPLSVTNATPDDWVEVYHYERDDVVCAAVNTLHEELVANAAQSGLGNFPIDYQAVTPRAPLLVFRYRPFTGLS